MAAPLVDQDSEVQEPVKLTRVFVVLNPVAGTTDAGTARETIERYCGEHGWQLEIHETKKDEDPRQVVRDQIRKGVDVVIAAGGDGTVAAVVAGMVNSHIPMGILPAGTGNALARDLSIPVDLAGALNVLGGNYSVKEMDIIEVENKDYYVMNVSVGISSVIMRKTGREEKRKYGFLAYLYNAVGSILHSDMHRFHLKVDNKPVRLHASEVMILNCKLMGLQPQLDGVEIIPDDGKLDIFVVRANSFRDYLGLLRGFLLRSKPDEETTIRYLNAQNTIQIQSEFPLPVQADGEEIGVTPVNIRLIPKALRVIVP